MDEMTMNIRSTLLLTPLLLLVGCSHTPTIGEQMMSHSEEAKNLAEQWKTGEKMVVDGGALNKQGKGLISDGNSKIKKGKKLISKGEKEVDLGNSMLDNSKKKITEGVELQKKSEELFNERYPEKLPH